MTTTARVTPGGIKPTDGFPTKIAFAADPDISFWEKTVKPPGVDGGDPIDTTTMFNAVYRTMGSRSLKTLTQGQARVTYDPEVFPQIVAMANVEGWITLHFWNGDTYDFYGFLKSFEPADVSEGSQPEADVVFVPTNTNPTTGAEAAPVLTEASGTP